MNEKAFIVMVKTADGKEYKIDLDIDTLNAVVKVLEDETKQTVKITTYYFFKSTITLFKVIGVTEY